MNYDLKYEGATMREVLEWASENVVSVDKQTHFPSWCAYLGPNHEFFYPGPTLYETLWTAYNESKNGRTD